MLLPNPVYSTHMSNNTGTWLVSQEPQKLTPSPLGVLANTSQTLST